MLAEDPTVRATVIRERLRPDGVPGRDHDPQGAPATVRPAFLAARAFQRTTYRPGEIGQVDWWHTGAQVPVGPGPDARGVRPRHDAAVLRGPRDHVHACRGPSRDLRPALLGCLVRLGGVPEELVFDNDASVVASGRGAGPPA